MVRCPTHLCHGVSRTLIGHQRIPLIRNWLAQKKRPTCTDVGGKSDPVPSHPMVEPAGQLAHHPYGLSNEWTAKIGHSFE